jgi:hypothetical protein
VTVRAEPTGYAHAFHRTDAVRYTSLAELSAYRAGGKHVTAAPADAEFDLKCFKLPILTVWTRTG